MAESDPLEEEEEDDPPEPGEDVEPELELEELDDEESLFDPESLLVLSEDFDDSPLPPLALSFLPGSLPLLPDLA